MKKIVNSVKIQGRLFDGDIQVKTVQNEKSENYGKEFINGTLNIAVDEEGTNVIPVHYSYVTATTKAGQANRTYAALKKIIDEGKFWATDGKDAATKVECTTAFDANDFVGRDEQIVAATRFEGGFVTILSQLKDEAERNLAQVDMIITKLEDVEENPERDIEAHSDIKGCTFDFRGNLIPLSFSVYNPKIVEWLEKNDVGSSPLFIKTYVKIENITKMVEVREELAFGEAVTTREKKVRNYIVYNFAAEPYEFDDENTITADELDQAMKNRELHLAEVKKNHEEWVNGGGATTAKAAPTPASKPKNRTYDF